MKSFAAEQQQIDALALAARRLRWANLKQADARATWAPLLENLPRLGLAAVLLYGGYLVIEGQATIGDLVAFNSYILLLQIPFRLLGFFMILGQRARASAGRIFEILDETPEVADHPDATALLAARGDRLIGQFKKASPDFVRDFENARVKVAKAATFDTAAAQAQPTLTVQPKAA